MTVSWTAPYYDGGLEITDYDLRYREKDTDTSTPGDQPGAWTTLTGSDDPGSRTTATISGLTTGTVYQLRGAIHQRDGRQRLVVIAELATAAHHAHRADRHHQVPVPQGLLDRPVRQRRGHHRLRRAVPSLHRHPPSAAPPTPPGGAWTTLSGAADPGTGTSATITGLINGTAYQVQVQATNIIGDSGWSTSAAGTPAVVAPDAPAAPTLTVYETSLGVSWSAPSDNGGSAVTDYNLQYRACTATTRHLRHQPHLGNQLDLPRPHRHRPYRHHRLSDQGHRLPGPGTGRQRHRRRRLVGLDHRHTGRRTRSARRADLDGQARVAGRVVVGAVRRRRIGRHRLRRPVPGLHRHPQNLRIQPDLGKLGLAHRR